MNISKHTLPQSMILERVEMVHWKIQYLIYQHAVVPTQKSWVEARGRRSVFVMIGGKE